MSKFIRIKIKRNVIRVSKVDRMDDRYDEDILRLRYNSYKKSYTEVVELKKNGIPLRHQNPPEDITENISKFIIRNYDNDPTCIWNKGINNNNKSRLSGDLSSNEQQQIEIKAFTSNGPIQFSPSNKFDLLYCLDLRNWLNDDITLWRINLSNDMDEFKNIKVNRMQTHNDQCVQGRRPHISWQLLYPQIEQFCAKVYQGTFENIFSAINLTTGNDTALPAKLYK
jgi:hypothetical protein